MKKMLAAQMYSFREFIKTPAEVKKVFAALRDMGYDSVQLSGSIAPMPTAELAAMLRETGLHAPTSHDNSARILEDPAQVASRLVELGCFHTAYPFPSGVDMTAEKVTELAKKLNECAVVMKRSGVTLAYHNHALELVRENGKTMLETIYANAPEMQAEIDTFWIQRGGGNPVEWILKFPNRLDVLHLKDAGTNSSSASLMKPVGDGNLNWDAVFAAAEKVGVKTYVVEHDGDCDDPFQSFEKSAKFIRARYIK